MLVAKAQVNYYPEETIEKPIKPVKKTRKKKKSNSLFKLMSIFMATIVMVICIFILVRYANITSIRYELTKLEKQKHELESAKLNLLAELEGVKSSLKIAEDATYKLGMNYPEAGQVMYVSVDEEIIEVAKGQNFSEKLKKVLSLFSSLF